MRSTYYISILLLLLSLPAIGQLDVGSLGRIWGEDRLVATKTLQASEGECPGCFLAISVEANQQQERPSPVFSKEQHVSLSNRLLIMEVGWLWLWALLAVLVAAGGGMLFKRYRELLSKQQELSAEVEGLKEKLVMQSLNTCTRAKDAPQLYRERIENAINSRLGESAWRILNLIVNNPAITNKEIAAEVNLSLDGVSSSLRRMYATFGVGGAGNKKIILAQKALGIITNSDSEVAEKE